jgi:hypothetical protein
MSYLQPGLTFQKRNIFAFVPKLLSFRIALISSGFRLQNTATSPLDRLIAPLCDIWVQKTSAWGPSARVALLAVSRARSRATYRAMPTSDASMTGRADRRAVIGRPRSTTTTTLELSLWTPQSSARLVLAPAASKPKRRDTNAINGRRSWRTHSSGSPTGQPSTYESRV